MCAISIYVAEVEHCREFHDGNPTQFRLTVQRELFCRDCGRQVAFTPAFAFPESPRPPSPDSAG